MLPERVTVGAAEEWAICPFFCFRTWVYGEMTSDELRDLLEPVVARLGYELTDLEAKIGGKSGVLRVFIDKPDGIDLDDCEQVSRAVSTLLDVEDPLPGHYDLEVSSPGLDRKLTKVEHFQRFSGEEVKIQTRFPIAGRKRYRGTLESCDNDNIKVKVDGQSFEIPIATIDVARLVPQDA